ncbi:MAG: DUF1905 domain-containing protein [Armatimonadetes bacterium]|nr:DUF1905 domain-containing protein [Armatimonadota bacterium]
MDETTQTIQFQATLRNPGGADKGAPWAFLKLPQEASDPLPARGMVSVEGTANGRPFAATLEPDGLGGHWLRVKPKLQEALGAKVGDTLTFEIAPAKIEPEPEVPDDFQAALDEAIPKARETWQAITALARRDWIHWIVSGKKAETRVKRIAVAMDKMSKGNRRPCCFDRSGMFDKSLSCPVADDE